MLGKLEKVDLRQIWQNEGQDFTPWLAQKENLELLGEVIRIELELEAQEKNVGPFRADILCKNTFAIILSKNIQIPKIILKKSIGEPMKLIQLRIKKKIC